MEGGMEGRKDGGRDGGMEAFQVEEAAQTDGANPSGAERVEPLLLAQISRCRDTEELTGSSEETRPPPGGEGGL